jgi:hypothetical protein
VPSEYVPVATNCFVDPGATLGLIGVTAIDTRGAFVTVRSVLPETAPIVAAIVMVPTATPLAKPFDPVALFAVPTPVFDELQITDVVRS